MKSTLILSILIFFTTVLDASYARSIRLSSFLSEEEAQKSLVELELFITKSSRLSAIRREFDFDVKVIKSGKYYMHNIEPLTDKKLVQETLDILRTKYSYVYPKKIEYNSSYDRDSSYEEKKLPLDRTKLMKKIDNILQDDAKENGVVAEEKNSYEDKVDKSILYPELPLNLPTLKYTHLKDKNYNEQSTSNQSLKDSEIDKLTVFKSYLFEMIVIAIVIIFILLLIIFYKYRKNRENKISLQKIYT